MGYIYPYPSSGILYQEYYTIEISEEMSFPKIKNDLSFGVRTSQLSEKPGFSF